MRSVLNVLPHPGGGGETYVDVLESMPGYRFDRYFLAPTPRPLRAAPWIVQGALRANIAARTHDLVHAHGEVASSFCLPSLATRPSVVTLHGLHLLRRMRAGARVVARANIRLIMRAAARTICVSRFEYDELIAACGPWADKRAVVIHNGLDLPAVPTEEVRKAVRAELGIADSLLVGVFVGALEDYKDPLTAALAANEVSRRGGALCLLMVGDGQLRPAIEHSIGAGDTVRLLGSRPDVLRILSGADFFVLSSRREGLPYSLLEAMSLGLPSVVSDQPELAETVGDAGLVVPGGDVRAFAAAFLRLGSKEGERTKLGERGRARVERYHRADEMIERTRGVYDDAISERHGRA